MIYFFNANMELKKIINSENVVSAVHEHELNGVILSAIELDLSYARMFKDDVEYFGYYYKNNFYIHKIRRVEEEHNNETIIFIGRHIFFDELMTGELVQDVRPVERDAVYTANATIGNTTRWKPFGNNTTKHLSSNFYWELPIEVLNTIVEQFQVEYLPIIEFDGKKITGTKLRIDERIGKDSGIRIPYGSRVLNLKYDIDYEQIITKLFVQGRGEEVGDGYGRRINIKELNFSKDSVVSPAGVFYLYDQSLIDEYGVRHGKEIFEDIEDVNELAQAGYDYYIENSRPKMLFTAEVAQIGDVSIGDTVNIIRREYDIYFKARIHKITVNLLNQSDASVELGDYEHFKESKAERIERKKNEIAKSETNNRIESLKRQFDTEFDAQVDEFRKEFEQKLIDVNAEIEASEQRMTDEMSQMKLDQQQRVDEIYEDIGDINQTVSDVANKADYLDGVYTDLSTQTGEVSSTVANIIDGKAPAGSVLKQTTDSVLNRVWEQDIDRIADTTNLISRSDIGIRQSATDFSNYSDKGLIIITVESTAIGGLYINASKLEPNTDYIISYKYRKISGNLIVFGGHVDAAFRNNAKVTIDGVEVFGYGADEAIPVSDNTTTHEVIYTFTTPSSVNASNRFYIQPNRQNTTPVSVEITELRMSKGSELKAWNYAPEDLLKHTDIIARPDSFLIGSFEMGGDKIAQAIVGKAGAIDLIADNVNLSNNLNVANQIKSLSLETVYANINELRTRMLVADVITADMVKFDTALIEKFTSNTAFINSLTAKSAFISNVKAIDIDLNRATVTGGDGTNYIRMTNQTVMSYGTFTRTWGGETDTARLELGLYDGQMRMRNLDTGYRLYLTERGLSTSMEGAIDQFTSGTLEFHSQRFNANSRGITMHSSYGTVAMVSDYSTAVIRSRLTANIESEEYSVYLRPQKNSRNGLNEFAFYIKANESSQETDGTLLFGDLTGANSSGSGLRFSKRRNLNTVYVTNINGDIGTGDISVKDAEIRGSIRTIGGLDVRTWDGTGYNQMSAGSYNAYNSLIFVTHSGGNAYLGVGSYELRVTNNNGYNGGNTTYQDIRYKNAQLLGHIAHHGTGGWFYIGAGGTNGVRFTNNNWSDGGYKNIQFQEWKAWSSESAKTEIEKWNLNVLDVIKEELQLYRYKFKQNVGSEYSKFSHGIILRNNPNEDEFPVEWRDEEAFNGNEVMWWTVKGVQELAHENDNLKSEIAELKSQINKIMEMIA